MIVKAYSLTPRRAVPSLAMLFAAVLGGCSGDSKAEQVQPGISRDSALQVLTQSAPASRDSGFSANADSLKNVWRNTPYLVDGKLIEIIWYSPSGEKRTARDTVPKERVIPVVVIDGKVVGVGRSALEKVYREHKLPQNKY